MLYEQRFKHVLANLSFDHPFNIPTSPMKCNSKKHLVTTTQALIKQAGEGTVIQKPHTKYLHGKTTSALKFKATRADMEALVVAANDSLYDLKLPNGMIFTSTSSLYCFPLVGDVVTFAFDSFHSQGIPKNTQITRLRKDVTWDHVLHNFHNHIAVPQTETLTTKKAFNTPQQFRQPAGYWTRESGVNTRNFFNNFARSHDFHPDDANAWYSCTTDMIFQAPGGMTVLHHYSGSLIRALIDVYPHLKMDASKFNFKSQYFWQDKVNRKKNQEKLSNKKDFDPLHPDNWYKISPFELKAEKGGSSFLNLYNSSTISALLDIYPNIGLDAKKFTSEARKYTCLKIPKEGKKFFDKLAQKNGIDPLVPENWYTLPKSTVLHEKGSRAILSHFQHSYITALQQIYPDIGLQHTKFRLFRTSAKYAKRFFDNFAKNNSFDPLVAANWYRVKKQDIVVSKVHIHFSSSSA
eukprot:Phypoly_transcript_01062.p1 GENE.Phypoly_transcript_01062~~Phypoly_transcript_01062.p1  ORF type:complete len:464 (+),score=56.48 Phypoly_transcript_01062:1819-3210(+)